MYYLKEISLCYNDFINDKHLTNKFVVCREVFNPLTPKKTNRIFASFANSDDFLAKTDYFNLDVHSRSFYEIISSDRNFFFKPFFDIDCNNESVSKKNMDKCILFFKKFLEEIFIKKLKKDNFEVLIFDSSSTEECKKSFHIVVDGIFFDNMENLKMFCLWCKNKFSSLNEKYFEYFSKYIDECVYKKNQQLRLLGSKKLGKSIERIKRPFIESSKEDTIFLFKKSLLTESQGKREIVTLIDLNFIEKNLIISQKQVITDSPSSYKKQFSCDFEDMNVKHSSFIEEYLDREENNVFEIKEIIKTELSIDDPEDNIFIIPLKRNEESYCEKCKRIHENENPFIVVFQKMNLIKFYCRREESNSRYSLNGNGTVIYKEKNDICTTTPNKKENEEDIFIKYFKTSFSPNKKRKEKDFSYI